jgi:hypothetical protein
MIDCSKKPDDFLRLVQELQSARRDWLGLLPFQKKGSAS